MFDCALVLHGRIASRTAQSYDIYHYHNISVCMIIVLKFNIAVS